MNPQELTRAEAEPLWRWERRVTWLQVAAMGCLLLAGGVTAYRGGDLAWFARPLLAGVFILLVAAAVLQFSGRCPRCRTRLRSGLLKMLPDKCRACGVTFPRPPPAGSG